MEDKFFIDRIIEVLFLFKFDLVSIYYIVFYKVVIEKCLKYFILLIFEL